MKLKNEMKWGFKYFCRDMGGKNLINRGPNPPQMPVGVGRPCGPSLPIQLGILQLYFLFM